MGKYFIIDEAEVIAATNRMSRNKDWLNNKLELLSDCLDDITKRGLKDNKITNEIRMLEDKISECANNLNETHCRFENAIIETVKEIEELDEITKPTFTF